MSARAVLAIRPAGPRESYLAQLHTELAVLQKWGAEPQARAVLHVIETLSEVEHDEQDEFLTLRAAARESGYSEDHLGRMVRVGTLDNHGRKGSPRVRRGDLPKRPVCLRDSEDAATVGASKAAIARAITRPK